MSTKRNCEELEIPSPKEMKELIAGLTPQERASLSDPNFITEDEAELILSDRSERDSTGETEHIPTGRRRSQRVA